MFPLLPAGSKYLQQGGRALQLGRLMTAGPLPVLVAAFNILQQNFTLEVLRQCDQQQLQGFCTLAGALALRDWAMVQTANSTLQHEQLELWGQQLVTALTGKAAAESALARLTQQAQQTRLGISRLEEEPVTKRVRASQRQQQQVQIEIRIAEQTQRLEDLEQQITQQQAQQQLLQQQLIALRHQQPWLAVMVEVEAADLHNQQQQQGQAQGQGPTTAQLVQAVHSCVQETVAEAAQGWTTLQQPVSPQFPSHDPVLVKLGKDLCAHVTQHKHQQAWQQVPAPATPAWTYEQVRDSCREAVEARRGDTPLQFIRGMCNVFEPLLQQLYHHHLSALDQQHCCLVTLAAPRVWEFQVERVLPARVGAMRRSVYKSIQQLMEASGLPAGVDWTVQLWQYAEDAGWALSMARVGSVEGVHNHLVMDAASFLQQAAVPMDQEEQQQQQQPAALNLAQKLAAGVLRGVDQGFLKFGKQALLAMGQVRGQSPQGGGGMCEVQPSQHSAIWKETVQLSVCTISTR
jgi:hypothetical protein